LEKLFKILFQSIYPILKNLNWNDTFTMYISLFINIITLIIVSYAILYFTKLILIALMAIIAKKTKTKFDLLLNKSKTYSYFSYIVPLIFIYKSVPIILEKFVYWENFFAKSIAIYIILLSIWILRTILNALKSYLKQKDEFSDKPIDSYIQVIMIILWLVGIAVIIYQVFDIKPETLLGFLGAISAIIILIFRDTILGLVASIQVTINDMVRIGDWITIDKFGADGYVIEINLATVKVQNFDHTTTTIPTYSLISDSFRNWRGMIDSDGRRIKRSINIKQSSIKFLNDKELDKYKKIQIIEKYISERQLEISNYNINNQIDKSLSINGRNLTNFGIFRTYINTYLEKNPAINKDLTIICRQLQPTPYGVPLEIYCFSKNKKFENYEFIMADIFDHIFASIPFFELEIYENSTILE
jgi:miniconductance mechanosensitive channel